MKALNQIKQAMDHWAEGQKSFDKASRVLASGPASHYYGRLEEYVTALFDRFAPFKDGDRVRITRPPNCDNGWKRCEHFLIEGSEGSVQSVDYRDGKFTAGVVFDNETWTYSGGNRYPPINKHKFTLSEDNIERIGEDLPDDDEEEFNFVEPDEFFRLTREEAERLELGISDPEPAFDGNLNAALVLLDRALEEIENGFVRCEHCGEQEDTKDLDFVEDLKAAKSELLVSLGRTWNTENE